MRIYKNKSFYSWMETVFLQDKDLKKAAKEIEKGLFNGNFGSALIKKRIGASGKGKRSGFRTLVIFKKDKLVFFVYGFAKNERDNINISEKKVYRRLAKHFLNMDKNQIQKMIDDKKLFEVK